MALADYETTQARALMLLRDMDPNAKTTEHQVGSNLIEATDLTVTVDGTVYPYDLFKVSVKAQETQGPLWFVCHTAQGFAEISQALGISKA